MTCINFLWCIKHAKTDKKIGKINKNTKNIVILKSLSYFSQNQMTILDVDLTILKWENYQKNRQYRRESKTDQSYYEPKARKPHTVHTIHTIHTVFFITVRTVMTLLILTYCNTIQQIESHGNKHSLCGFDRVWWKMKNCILNLALSGQVFWLPQFSIFWLWGGF